MESIPGSNAAIAALHAIDAADLIQVLDDALRSHPNVRVEDRDGFDFFVTDTPDGPISIIMDDYEEQI